MYFSGAQYKELRRLRNLGGISLLLATETMRYNEIIPGRGKSHGQRSLVGYSPWGRTRLSDFTFTFHFHALEKEMATHSSVLAWRIPGTVEPGGLPSMGSHRVRHNWGNLAAAAAATIITSHRVLNDSNTTRGFGFLWFFWYVIVLSRRTVCWSDAHPCNYSGTQAGGGCAMFKLWLWRSP